MERKIKLLALLEATTVTGVAKNVLDFCGAAREMEQAAPGSAPLQTTLATFHRPGGDEAPPGPRARRPADSGDPDLAPNEFVRTARQRRIFTDVIPERFRFDPRVIGELRSVFSEREPDIVVTHNQKSHFLVRLAGLHRRTRWVAFHHGYTTTDFKMRAYNRLNRWALPAAHRVVTVCDAFARELAGEGVRADRIVVLHNSISAGEAAPRADSPAARSSLGLGADEKILLSVGRLSREKAHADLIEAFRLLLSEEPGTKAALVIVGDGPERSRLEAAAAAAGGRVLFAGQQGDVRPFYAAADLLVLPSHSEGSPYVLLEAMAAGLPVVATRVGGVPEMVEDGRHALLIPPRDPRAMAAAIRRLLADAPLADALGRAAREAALTRFSPEAYVRGLVKIYRDLVR